jgi:hypothetical protein
VLFRSNSQLVEEGMMPDSLHVVPVVDDTVLNGVLEVEDTSLGLSFVTNVGLFVVHADHYTGHLGSANDSWETAPGGIISSNTGFALTRSIINNNCSLVFGHLTKRYFLLIVGLESWIFMNARKA